MFAADNGERDDVAVVVEDLEAFLACGGGEAGDHAHAPESADVTVAGNDVTAAYEVFVHLRRVESANHRPDGLDGGADLLDHGGAALVGADGVGVVTRHLVGDVELCGGGWGDWWLFVAEDGGGGWRRVSVNSVE